MRVICLKARDTIKSECFLLAASQHSTAHDTREASCSPSRSRGNGRKGSLLQHREFTQFNTRTSVDKEEIQ